MRADDLNHDHADQNTRAQLRGLKVKRGAIRADDGDDPRALRAHAGGHLSRGATRPATLFAHAGRLLVHDGGPDRPRAVLRRRPVRQARRRRDARSTSSAGSSTEGDRLAARRSTRRRSAVALRRSSAGRKGAVVALDPRTGAIKAMASVPGYDPNAVRDPQAFRRLQTDDANSPLFNRADAGRLPAGLDVQGRDDDRGDRLGQVHAAVAARRQERRGSISGVPLTERRRRVVRRRST